jgi:solute carrier family 27 fatty acid transporter 1/4
MHTGTFKLLKVDLQKDGFDISRIKDALYFLRDGKYSPLDKTLYEDVISGRLRL